MPNAKRLPNVSFVFEGWWHPSTKSGQVHDHPEEPGVGWQATMHRQCEPVYTRREESPPGS